MTSSCIVKTLKKIVALVVTFEIASAFENRQDAIVKRRTLIGMDYPQPPTSVKLDNTIETSFVKGALKQKRAKSMDMKHY